MGDEKPETLDFVKDFQEYLSQQTQHVNMISGSVSGVKDDPDDLPGEVGQNGLGVPVGDIVLEDASAMLVDGFERTYDGKLKCRYCSYATRGTARLIEHMRIHTGEKPHRCHLCPFASAYERHLEAHMRSHTGEKPYACDLCSFRCSDRSNLSHHRRRRHKLLPMRGPRSALSHAHTHTHRKMLSVLQKRGGALGYGRRLLINLSPPSMVLQKPSAEQLRLGDYSHDLHQEGHDLHHEAHLHQEAYEGLGKEQQSGGAGAGSSRDGQDVELENPLTQLSTLAGQLAALPPEAQGPLSHTHTPEAQGPVSHTHMHTPSPGAQSPLEEKPTFLIQHPATAPAALSHTHTPTAQASSPLTPEPPEPSERTSSPSGSTSHPGTPPHTHTLHHCPHCGIYFPDNILYTIHMGCHGYQQPFQCNICGLQCSDRYDFACHFARGQHKQ